MLTPGTTIAGYRIDGVLGEGGMGVVYEATQLSLDRKVALKVLATRLGEDDGFRRRFRREGRLQAAIDHPNIVAVHEAGESEEGLFLAMRLVRGRTLKELVRSGTLDASRTLVILRPIAEALDSAHAAGLIHRDVKPHNILVGPQDEAYLGDFGLTKTPDDLNLTRSGEFFGTPNYVAPEHVRGEPATAAGDVYSLGAVLYECLTGMVPFPKASHAAVLFAHVHAPPPRVTALRPDLPRAIDDVVAQAMAKDPRRRQPSATALLADAKRALGEAASPFYVPAAPPAVRHEDDVLGGTRGPDDEPDGDTLFAPAADAGPEDETVGASARHGVAADPDAPSGARTGAADAAAPNGAVVAADPDAPSRAGARLRATNGASRAGPALATTSATLHAAEAPTTALSATRSRLPLAAAAAVAALAAAGAGFALAPEPRDPGPAERALTAPGVRVSVPADWAAGRPPESLARTGLTEAVAPASPEGAGLLVGRIPGARLPAGLRRAVVRVPEPERVRVAGGQAYRYDDLRLRDGGLAVTVYLLPTTSGAAVAACHAPAAAAGFAATCERAAGTLRATSGKPVPLGPDRGYARDLTRVLRRLDDRRTAARRRLDGARTAARQAAQAARVASAFATASRDLGRVRPPAGGEDAHAAQRRALERAARAYRDLRAAAAAGSRPRYAAARRAAVRAEAGVREAVRALRRLGYRIA